MRIGIDARLIHQTGVGRYIRNLIRELARLKTTHTFVIFLPEDAYDSYILPGARWTKVKARVRWHTVCEQLVMPWLFYRNRLDLVHIPYHTIPVLYRGAYIVTIHDLIILHYATGKATNLPYPLYAAKRLGYRLMLRFGLANARKIIAVSQATKHEITRNFPCTHDRISVTYEAADTDILAGRNVQSDVVVRTRKPYVLYVGNSYPHKNLERLVDAWEYIQELSLVIVTPKDVFSGRLIEYIQKGSASSRIRIQFAADAAELGVLYAHARMLVFPSLMEGFGLPGVEAMAMGVPVVCSDIPVFREVYGDACLVFDPNDPKNISQKIHALHVDKKLRDTLIAAGKKQITRYSWKTMAEETLRIYEDSTCV